MKQSLKIAVADDEAFMRSYYQEVLPELGHEVVAAASNGQELVERCLTSPPDLVITDIRMPGTDGIDAARALGEAVNAPVILVSAYSDDDLISRAESDRIMAYLIKPIRKENLQPAIQLAMRRHEQFEALRKESADMRQALADRKVIERAKGILMKRGGFDEQEAFRRLQKTARDRNLKLVAAAQMFIAAEEALQPH